MKYYLAIDIGASSGRHILGYIKDGVLHTEELYRFDNSILTTDEGLVWDIEHLVQEVIVGLKSAHEKGVTPTSVAIDTWGVDYCLLDKEKQLLSPVFAYRDPNRQASAELVNSILPHQELYKKTGIQFQPFNTVYQLYHDRVSGKLDNAAYFMQIPDYIAYRLTGVIQNEYTNATTTSLVNVHTKSWDRDLLNKLGLPDRLFGELTPPATEIGSLSQDIAEIVGYQTKVIACPTHDTASAFAAVGHMENSIILSSGTWSLIGTEQKTPIVSSASRLKNFTNEGGIEYRFRHLKNIMGMWLLQSVRKEIGKIYSYNEMMEMASQSTFDQTFDVNHPSLSAPSSMINAITLLLGKENLPLGDLLASIYKSLANSYKNATEEITSITGKTYHVLQIVGGGSSDTYLNQLTKEATGLRIFTGPKEGTSLGNLASQILCDTSLTLSQVREIVQKSCSIHEI